MIKKIVPFVFIIFAIVGIMYLTVMKLDDTVYLARKIEYDKGFPTDSPFPAAMYVEYISLMRSDRGWNGMIYTNMGDFACN